MRVPLDQERLVRLVADHVVRAVRRGRRVRERLRRGAGRNRRRERQRHHVEEVRLGLLELDLDRARCVVGDDAGDRLAARRVLLARVHAFDVRVEADAGRVHLEVAHDRGGEVARLEGLSVRIHQSLAERELVVLAAGTDDRHGRRKRRDHVGRGRAAGVLLADETFVDVLEELPGLEAVGQARVHVVGVSPDDVQRREGLPRRALSATGRALLARAAPCSDQRKCRDHCGGSEERPPLTRSHQYLPSRHSCQLLAVCREEGVCCVGS